MTLPTPPRYVVLPEEIIEQAYAPEKPRRALLASFTRIISLAWEAKYQHTPALDVKELQDFLKLSPRQYFDQIADMDLLGWLRSTHPKTGFVQFTFSRSVSEKLVQDISAENRTGIAENRTELRIEEEESINSKEQESSSSILLRENEVRKTAQNVSDAASTYPEWMEKIKLLVEHLTVLFDPEIYGVLEMRDEFLAAIPERALGWIAKAYQDRQRFRDTNGAIGLIVNHLVKKDAPRAYYTSNYLKILPEAYLEAVGEIEYSCDHCSQVFGRHEIFDHHMRSDHCICSECGKDFTDADARAAHFAAEHDLYRVQAKPTVIQPAPLDGSVESAWTNVLSQLQQDMPRASFDTWVRDTEPVRYDGNVLEIATRNAYAQEWLTNRMTSTVQRILVGMLPSEVTVKFVVLTAVPVEEES